MTLYVVVDCPRCRKLFIRRFPIKYTTCPYCGKKFRVLPTLRVFKSLEKAKKVRNQEKIRV